MADPNHSAIDRVFDLVDGFVDSADRVLNRSKGVEDKHRARRARTIDTAPSVRTSKPAPASSSTAIVRTRFRLIESNDATTGVAVFIVTDGGAAKVECNTREMAEKILRALETAP